MNFYEFDQNNSGGYFEDPGVNVYVESDNIDDAISLASEKGITICGDSGLYAEYDACGCCPCCGHRWYSPDQITDPSYVCKSYFSFEDEDDLEYLGRYPRFALIKNDGSIVSGINQASLDYIRLYVLKGLQ